MRLVRFEVSTFAVEIGAQEVVQTLLACIMSLSADRVVLYQWLRLRGGFSSRSSAAAVLKSPVAAAVEIGCAGGPTKGTLSSVTVRKMSGRISALQAAGYVPMSWPTTPTTSRWPNAQTTPTASRTTFSV